MFAEACFVIIVNGASVPDTQSWLRTVDSSATISLSADAERSVDDVTSIMRMAAGHGTGDGLQALAARAASASAGDESSQRPDVLPPIVNGRVGLFLKRPGIRDGLADLLATLAAGLPTHRWGLDVVHDVDSSDEDGVLMLVVYQTEDDIAAFNFVEELIANRWVSLPPHVRRDLSVGREFVSMG